MAKLRSGKTKTSNPTTPEAELDQQWQEFLQKGKREPQNFLEQHALSALQHEKDWTVSMYCVYNDLDGEAEAGLRDFLAFWLPAEQLR